MAHTYQRGGELVDHVGVRPAMAGALQEGEVVGVLDRAGEPPEGLGKDVRVVGDLHLVSYIEQVTALFSFTGNSLSKEGL